MAISIAPTGDYIAMMTGGLWTISLNRRTEQVGGLDHSPAAICVNYIVNDLSGFTDPADDSDWPMFIGHVPEIIEDCAGVFDTSGIIDGRYMTGDTIDHYGIEIMVRSRSYETGYEKINTLVELLDTMHREDLTIGDDSYRIQAFTRTSSVGFLGIENERIDRNKKRRFVFSTNFLVSVTKI